MSDENLRHIHQAYRENKRLGGFKRLFPTKNQFNGNFETYLTPNNEIQMQWFEAKCRESKEWC
jgi:hypothetical protein